jgi:flagellar motor switch protein FliN/FliY
MNNNFLTQEEISALLEVKDESPQSSTERQESADKESDSDKDEKPELRRDSSANLELIMDFSLTLSVRLGKNSKNLGDTRGIGPGTVLELDRFINQPLDILINNKLIAQGEVVVIDESFGIKITQIINPIERIRRLG